MDAVFILCVVSLWITSCAALDPGFFVSAPDIIRVGVEEKVLISVHNTEDSSSLPIRLRLQSHPNRDIVYDEKQVYIQPDQPQIVTLRIDPNDVETTTKHIKQYTSLVVKSEASADHIHEIRREILLSYRSGYVFIQTDKPVYTPDHDVKMRVISLDQDMKPSTIPIKFEIRNPQDIIVELVEDVKSDTGFITETFHFPLHPLFGDWSIVAYYGHKQQHNTTVTFIVKEYVLPSFSVRISHTKYFILPNTDNLLFDIWSKNTLGQPVQGDYYVEYHAVLPGGEMRYLTSTIGKLNNNGRALVGLKTNNYNWSDIYRGARLNIHVTVTEHSSGMTEGANNTQVMFVDTPYVFKWDKTVRYFKRGLPFEVKVDLKYANGQPASRIPVSAVTIINSQSEHQRQAVRSSDVGEVRFIVDEVHVDTTKLTIELETADSTVVGYNAFDSFDVWPQQAPSSGNLLLVQILPTSNIHESSSATINVGQTIDVELKRTGGIDTAIYMFVVSKGQIVDNKIVTSSDNSVQVDLQVTYDMVPHSRLIAYMIDENNQIVADSVWFDVKHICKSEVKVDSSETEAKPKDEIALQIYGDPGTNVGILAIDSAVYLLQNEDKLTKDKMFKKMDDYDLSCGPGGGRNVEAIFMESGVTVITNYNGALQETSTRHDETCGHAERRKRRDVIDDLASQYEPESDHHVFCLIGASEHRNSTSECNQHAYDLAREYELSLDDDIIQAFYNCCVYIVDFETDNNEEVHVEEDVRSDFPETWIFEQVELDDFGSAQFSIAAPDTATTWLIQAVGVSSESGMCVAEPTTLRVQPDIFTKVYMPSSVVRTEQVEIVATVTNYLQHPMKANVSLFGTDGLCSETSPGTWSPLRQFKDIGPSETVLVKFNIVPLGVGEFPVEIKVVTPNGEDIVRDHIKVVPEGYPRKHLIQIPLDPTGSNQQATNPTSDIALTHQNIPTQKAKHQRDHINITLPTGTVPASASLTIHVTGNLMGHVVPATIQSHRLTSDLDEPGNNNGEKTAADTASSVYVLKYLTETNQLTSNLTERLHRNIQAGITTQYTYRKEDSGSYAYDPLAHSSTWLTAFVNKIFCHAREFHFIDPQTTVTATNWLTDVTQRADGSFHEVYKLHIDNISGALEDEYLGNHDAAITAYVLISLMECNSTAMQYHGSVVSATLYLEHAIVTLHRPFDLAIVTYALALVGSNVAMQVNQRLLGKAIYDAATEAHHWEENLNYESIPDIEKDRVNHWTSVKIETTGYALLAQLKLQNIQYSHSIARWLSRHQRLEFTQDTIIALQALSEYAIWSNDDKVNLQTTITTDRDGSFSQMVHIHPGNALLQQTFQGPVDGQLIVDTKGTGTGQLVVQVKYHTAEDIYNNCLFDIRIVTGEGNLPHHNEQRLRRRRSISHGSRKRRNTALYLGHVKVCTRYLGNAQNSNKAVIDVGLYTGFRPVNSTLNQIINLDNRILRYHVSDRSVIFYLHQIPSAFELCLPFEIAQENVVGKTQPVAVRVYKYQEPGRDCVKFYHPTSGVAMLSSICEGQTCVCAEGRCPTIPCEAATCHTSCQQLLDMVYLRNTSDPRTKSTFAYKVSFGNLIDNPGFEVFHMNILSAYLIGGDTALEGAMQQNSNQTVVRQFWHSRNCRRQEILKKTKREYLMIGTGGLRYRDENGEESFKYILDDTYIFEDWPKGNRATRRGFIPQVNKLEALSIAIREGGQCST